MMFEIRGCFYTQNHVFIQSPAAPKIVKQSKNLKLKHLKHLYMQNSKMSFIHI